MCRRIDYASVAGGEKCMDVLKGIVTEKYEQG